MSDWNTQVIEEFRANGGRVGQFGDVPLVILHTIGAKSGELREIPLVIKNHHGQAIVFASAGGSPKHPDWYYNLLANPVITVETGTETYAATLTELPADEAAAALAAQAEVMPQFGDYIGSAAPRIIPAFSIVRS
jgi:deazaflavin-dependent oxidoreductase (nitroreductase family)